jgi:hypothetical protein
MSGGFLSSNNVEGYLVDNDNIGWSPPQGLSEAWRGKRVSAFFNRGIRRGSVPSGEATFIAVVKDG